MSWFLNVSPWRVHQSTQTGEIKVDVVVTSREHDKTAVLKEGGSRASKRVEFRTEWRCRWRREEDEEGDELVVDGKKKGYCSWSNKKKSVRNWMLSYLNFGSPNAYFLWSHSTSKKRRAVLWRKIIIVNWIVLDPTEENIGWQKINDKVMLQEEGEKKRLDK